MAYRENAVMAYGENMCGRATDQEVIGQYN